jgi:hypothetical protein
MVDGRHQRDPAPRCRFAAKQKPRSDGRKCRFNRSAAISPRFLPLASTGSAGSGWTAPASIAAQASRPPCESVARAAVDLRWICSPVAVGLRWKYHTPRPSTQQRGSRRAAMCGALGSRCGRTAVVIGDLAACNEFATVRPRPCQGFSRRGRLYAIVNVRTSKRSRWSPVRSCWIRRLSREVAGSTRLGTGPKTPESAYLSPVRSGPPL